jgi:hypothetical protein
MPNPTLLQLDVALPVTKIRPLVPLALCLSLAGIAFAACSGLDST